MTTPNYSMFKDPMGDYRFYGQSVPKLNMNMGGMQLVPTETTPTFDMDMGKTPSMFDKFSQGYSANKDMINGGVGAALGLLGAYNGYQQNKNARESLDFSRAAFAKNYEAQRSITNSRLENQAAMRYGANPNREVKPSEYMAKYGIK
jgi:hypothetical protein